jgi:hypothetical protein
MTADAIAAHNQAVVQRFFDEVCNARHLGGAEELFSADHRYHDPSIPGVPAGPAGMKQVVAVYQTGFPDAFWHVEDMVAAEEKVVPGQGRHASLTFGSSSSSSTKSSSVLAWKGGDQATGQAARFVKKRYDSVHQPACGAGQRRTAS